MQKFILKKELLTYGKTQKLPVLTEEVSQKRQSIIIQLSEIG